MKILLFSKWMPCALVLLVSACDDAAQTVDKSANYQVIKTDRNSIVLSMTDPGCEITIKNIHRAAHIEVVSEDGHKLLFSLYGDGDVRSKVVYQGGVSAPVINLDPNSVVEP